MTYMLRNTLANTILWVDSIYHRIVQPIATVVAVIILALLIVVVTTLAARGTATLIRLLSDGVWWFINA